MIVQPDHRTGNPAYVHPAKEGHQPRVICLLCFGFHQKPKAEQDSEADTGSSGLPYQRDIQTFNPSKRTKPPAYLFSYPNCQRASETKNRTGCALSSRRALPELPLIYPPNLAVPSSVPRPNRASAPPVRGYLRPTTNLRKTFFQGKRSFCEKNAKSLFFISLGTKMG